MFGNGVPKTQIEAVPEHSAEENVWTKEEVAGGWRRLHNEELHNVYDSPNNTMMSK
jgi:hypothetical protein